MDSEINCYICFDTDKPDKPLMPTNPCNCKGSIFMHWACFGHFRKLSAVCAICKIPYQMQVTNKDSLILTQGYQQTYISLTGKIIGTGPVIGDVKHGHWQIFYPTGVMKEEGGFMENMPHGLWKTYYESGAIKSEVTYMCAKANGPAKYYYESGTPKSEGSYLSNKQHGNWLSYDESGHMIKEETYDSHF